MSDTLRVIRAGEPHETVTATGQRILVRARNEGILDEKTGKIITAGEMANALTTLGFKVKKRGDAKRGG